jgi:CheY-like chemotaxis protein
MSLHTERSAAILNGRPSAPGGVLVVDDDADVRRVLAAGLRGEGYTVWLAGHGHQAIELFQQHRRNIAAILLDVRMPGLDGPRTLAALQRLHPNIRCCFMTGNPTPYSEEALLEMGALQVFRKPFAFSDVIQALEQLMDRLPRREQEAQPSGSR